MDELYIESLDDRARGLAHRGGKRIYVEGALPGERVQACAARSKPAYEIAVLDRIVRASSQRVAPRCPHFGTCGGCRMQHLDPGAQVAVKQRLLEDAFKRTGGIEPECMLPPIHGPAWGYRYRARLAVRDLRASGGDILIGFRERDSSYIADIHQCPVLPASVSSLFAPLRALVAALSTPNRLPQIEVAVGAGTLALVLRHLVPLTDSDMAMLRAFASRHAVSWWLQPGGPHTAAPLDPEDLDTLAYALPEFGLHMRFRPTDFIQINPFINRILVSRALNLLQAEPGERVADLFCGLGNFTLPLAAQGCNVLGVEASDALVARARESSVQHGLPARFLVGDLFAAHMESWLDLGQFDRILIDPPREGAQAVSQALARLPAGRRPRCIAYISCNPATLARDAAILYHKGGYRLRSAGVVNMFPHTAHVESIALFA